MKKSKNIYPRAWNEARIRRVIEYYELQSEADEAAEIEQALIADADNPEALEEPITVAARKAPRRE